jgi:hypothetical protein
MSHKHQSRELRALTGQANENILQKRTRGKFTKPENTDKHAPIETSNSKKLRKDLTDLSTQQQSQISYFESTGSKYNKNL